MANGDAAAAAGMDVVSGAADIKKSYDEINKTRDYLAGHETAGGHPAASVISSGQLPITKGGTGAATFAAALAALHAVEQGGGTGMGTNRIRIGWASDSSGVIVQVDNTVIGKIYFGTPPNPDLSSYQQKGVNYEAGNGVLVSPGGRNSTATSGYAAAYFNGDGTLRISPSALRFKENIVEWEESDLDAFLALRDVKYTLIGDTEHVVHVGWIAEEVIAAGLEEIVPTNTDPEAEDFGLPISIDYALAVIPLHMLAKRQAAQIADLTARIESLEANRG